MKLTTGMVALALTMGAAWAQNPATILQNTKTQLQGVQQQKVAASNAALQGNASAAKPSAGPAIKTTPAPAKPAVAPPAPKTAVKTPFTKPAAPAKAKAKAVAAAPAAAPAQPKEPEAAIANSDTPKADKQEDKKYSMTGKRDPFISPVVNRQGGSGCSTGKKCLDIDQIAVRGVVKSDAGMIAVVTNGLNKAYFLRENDPVFNGYVVKITVDSVVFKQNFQDRLGKPFTKDVVKRITTPAV
jgi:hypothetical protein